MPTLIIPNSFIANTPAQASAVNANFSAVATLLNSTKLDSTNLQAAAVATANLADASVTRAKLATDAFLTSSYELSNVSLSASVSANALTIALKGKDGTDPSSSNIVNIGFRNATAATGTYTTTAISAATSVTVSSGSTLGTKSGVVSDIYVYAINNSGSVELAVSLGMPDENSVVSTTAEGGAGAADSSSVIYSTTARSNVPCRLIGRVTSTQATAGTWVSAPTQISLAPLENKVVTARYTTTATPTIGTSDTLIDYETIDYDSHNAVTTGGSWKFTAPKTGVYDVSVSLLHDASRAEEYVTVYKNGVLHQYIAANVFTSAISRSVQGSGSIYLIRGEYIDIRAALSSTSNALSSNATLNWVAISSVS